MAGTKIRQDQIQNLDTDLSTIESIDDSLESLISQEISESESADESLESIISQEVSESESADESLESSLSSQQLEINLLKTVCRGLLFPPFAYIYQQDYTMYFGERPFNGYPLPVTITYSWEYADDQEALNFTPIDGADLSFYTPESTASYLYRLKITYTSDLGVAVAFSQDLTYDPNGVSGGSGSGGATPA